MNAISTLLLCVLAILPCAQAQQYLLPYEMDQRLMTSCWNGIPIPENTIIRIYHDVNSDGPSTFDPLCPVAEDSFSFNQIPMNGCADLGFPGGFYFTSYLFYQPARLLPNRIYLRIRYPDTWNYTVEWTSEVMEMHDIDFAEHEVRQWTCRPQLSTSLCFVGPAEILFAPQPGGGFQSANVFLYPCMTTRLRVGPLTRGQRCPQIQISGGCDVADCGAAASGWEPAQFSDFEWQAIKQNGLYLRDPARPRRGRHDGLRDAVLWHTGFDSLRG